MRIARLFVPDVVYHLIWRFVDRQWFFSSDEERETYLRMLAHALAETDWRCLAYALMSNHIHLAAVAGRCPLGPWAKAVNAPFAQWMNQRHGRLGPLFADRPRARATAPEKEAAVISYIHNNPVRAGVVKWARDSTWTSHRAYVGLTTAPTWLHTSEGLARCRIDDGSDFDHFVAAQHTDLEHIDLAAMGHAARKRGAIALATPNPISIPLVRRPFGHVRPDPRRLVEVVANLTGLPLGLICSRRQIRAACGARRIAAHSGLVLGISNSDVAAALGISPQAVSRMTRSRLDALQARIANLVCDRLLLELGCVN